MSKLDLRIRRGPGDAGLVTYNSLAVQLREHLPLQKAAQQRVLLLGGVLKLVAVVMSVNTKGSGCKAMLAAVMDGCMLCKPISLSGCFLCICFSNQQTRSFCQQAWSNCCSEQSETGEKSLLRSVNVLLHNMQSLAAPSKSPKLHLCELRKQQDIRGKIRYALACDAMEKAWWGLTFTLSWSQLHLRIWKSRAIAMWLIGLSKARCISPEASLCRPSTTDPNCPCSWHCRPAS